MMRVIMLNANALAQRLCEIMDGDMKYCLSLSQKDKTSMMRDVYRKTDMMQRV